MTDAPGPPASRVGRRTRLADAAALLLLVGGAAVYMYAQVRMGELAAGRMRHDSIGGPPGGWNLTVWGHLVTTSRVGLGLVGAGLVVGVASFAHHFFERRSSRHHEQADHP